MKRIIAAVLLVVSLVLTFVGPYNIFDAFRNKQLIENVVQEYSSAKASIDGTRREVFSAQAGFEDGRTFNVDYKDVNQLVTVLDNIVSITVASVTAVDAQNYFTQIGEYDESMAPTAVTISLVVEDTVSALNVIDKMELPIYQIFVSSPNLIDVTFLTGGAIV